jgi:hypothetical protein
MVDLACGHLGFGPNVKLPPRLAHHFSVIHHDRRGPRASDDCGGVVARPADGHTKGTI